MMNNLMKFRRHDPWSVYRRRATEGIATWLSRLPGGVEKYLPDGGETTADARNVGERLHAFVRDLVTSNPMTREPLSPVQIHLLELVLEAVDWPTIAVAGELLDLDSPTAAAPGPCVATACRGGAS